MENNTVMELRDRAKATLKKQHENVRALAECGSDGFNMEAMILSGMIEIIREINLLSEDEIGKVIKSVGTDREE